MAKKIIEDIVVSKKSDIRTPQREEPVRVHVSPIKEPQPVRHSEKSFIFSEKKKGFNDETFFEEDERALSRGSQITLWIICIASIATLLFFLSMLFATATVTITPKSEPITLNATYIISSSSAATGLHYEILSVTKTDSQSLETNGTQQVSNQSIGKATIYNIYSTASQRLINNTRLETADGRIYRIRNSVTVPGMKTVNGTTTPGSVEIEIIADQPGDTYNMKVSDFKGDFTIPGFLGMPQYKGFYARLSADAVGGFVGTVKTVSPEILAAGQSALQSQLKDELVKELYAELPASDTLFKNDYFISYTNTPDDAETNSYTISNTGIAYAVVFHTDELDQFIAQNTLPDFNATSTFDILWNDGMSVNVSGSTTQPWTENTLSAYFSGSAQAVWRYDTSAILNQIKGQNKSVLQDILDTYAGAIVSIAGNIQPQWKGSFPSDINKITIVDTVRSVIPR